MRTTRIAPVLLVLLVAPPAGAADATVQVLNNRYSPVSVSIDVGDTVTWQWPVGFGPHSVTADDGSFDSHPSCGGFPPVVTCGLPGETFARTFTAAGTYAYHCRIHGAAGGVGMSGTVVVG
jgi:plastocyanin